MTKLHVIDLCTQWHGPAGRELARLRDIERTTDEVTADWSRRCQELEDTAERLLVLATKWCDKEHHDWDEIKRIAEGLGK